MQTVATKDLAAPQNSQDLNSVASQITSNATGNPPNIADVVKRNVARAVKGAEQNGRVRYDFNYAKVFSACCAEYKSKMGLEAKDANGLPQRLPQVIADDINHAIESYRQAITASLFRMDNTTSISSRAVHRFGSLEGYVKVHTMKSQDYMELEDRIQACKWDIGTANRRLADLLGKNRSSDDIQIINARKNVRRLETTLDYFYQIKTRQAAGNPPPAAPKTDIAGGTTAIA